MHEIITGLLKRHLDEYAWHCRCDALTLDFGANYPGHEFGRAFFSTTSLCIILCWVIDEHVLSHSARLVN